MEGMAFCRTGQLTVTTIVGSSLASWKAASSFGRWLLVSEVVRHSVVGDSGDRGGGLKVITLLTVANNSSSLNAQHHLTVGAVQSKISLGWLNNTEPWFDIFQANGQVRLLLSVVTVHVPRPALLDGSRGGRLHSS